MFEWHAFKQVSVSGRKNLSIAFEQELRIPVWVPSLSKRAALTIVNREFRGLLDVIVATAYIDFDEIPRY